MTNEFIRTIDKARTAATDAAKALPQQLRDGRLEIPKIHVQAFGVTLVSQPPRTIKLPDVTFELPKADLLNDRLDQVKVLAPIDFDALVARLNEVGDYLQTLPAKIQEVPSRLQEVPTKVQGFVSELPENASKLVDQTTTKAKAIVEDLKHRPIVFVPARKPAAKKATAKKATRKPAAKKATTAKKAAKPAANGQANGAAQTTT